MTSKSRLPYIDFLKFIGLTGIILAHVGSPDAIMMIRSFDVPLMVIVSSLLAERSFQKYASSSTLKYLVSRAKRLVLPTWIFLTFYFCIYAILSRRLFDVGYYINSYALTGYGIGYIWIILIYLYCALLIPLFAKFQLCRRTVIAIAILYIAYEFAYYFHLGTDNEILRTTFYNIIPYGTLAFIGYNYNNMQTKTKRTILGVSCVVFVVLAAYYWISTGEFQLVNIVKFPPRMYYLIYGVMCSFALLLFCENHPSKIYRLPIIHFISSHSMWIYLWHILWLTTYDFTHLPDKWYIRLITVYFGSMLTVFILNKCLDKVEANIHLPFIKCLRG